MCTIEKSLESIRQIRDNIALKADILETELDVVGASSDDMEYLNNLKRLAQSLSDVLLQFC